MFSIWVFFAALSEITRGPWTSRICPFKYLKNASAFVNQHFLLVGQLVKNALARTFANPKSSKL